MICGEVPLFKLNLFAVESSLATEYRLVLSFYSRPLYRKWYVKNALKVNT